MPRRLLAPALALVLSSLALAQPLTTSFTFQGQLKTAGSPASGLYDARFRLYDSAAGGTQLGPTLCSDNLTLTDGTFTTQLDFGAQFSGQQRFLEIDIRQDTGLNCANVTGFTTLAPRQPLTAAPNAVYSLSAATASTAANATQLNSQPAAFYQNAANLSGTLPDARLTNNVGLLNSAQVFSAAKTFSAAPAFTAAGVPFSVSSTTVVPNLNADLLDGLSSSAFLQSVPLPLTLSGVSASHIIRGDNQFSGTGATGLVGTTTSPSGFTYGVWGISASTSGRGVYGLCTATTGVNYAVYGENESSDGMGVYGTAPFGTGGRFDSASTSGTGAMGYASANTGSTRGVYGVSNSPQGSAVFGQSNDTTGSSTGVFGINGSTAGRGIVGVEYATTGITYGVDGSSASTSGIAVRGVASATSGVTTGVYGLNSSPSGYAGHFEGPGADCVYINNTGSGRGLRITSPSDTAVWAITSGFAAVDARNDATSGSVYGLIGRTASPAGFGVFSSGNMGASGVKPFRIDHPADPQNKYLLHYSSESPDVINFYSGKALLNEQGECTIELPSYFASINKDPRYTLTAIGAAMPLLHIAEEVSDQALEEGAKAQPGQPVPLCTFRIAGGAPRGKVSWRIDAVRNDRWMQTHGAPVEVAKQGVEKGTYQHPDLYNQPAEVGMNASTATR